MRLPRDSLPWLAFRFRRAPRGAQQSFFFHIPKCAGTSVWAALYDIYGTRNVYLANNKRRRRKFAALPLEARHSYAAVGGHGPLSYFRAHLGDMAHYHKIVTLRDPIDRAISEYNYICAQHSHPRNVEVSALSLDAFAAESLRPDRQVELLTGRSDDVTGAVVLVTQFFDDWSLSEGVGDLVGRLYDITGTAPRNAQHKNRSTSGLTRSDLDPATVDLLKARNRHDLALIETLREIRI